MYILISAIWYYILYLFLTAGSGSIGLWSSTELLLGLVISIITAFFTQDFIKRRFPLYLFNPYRIFLFIIYAVGPFFISMAKANIDVAYRVITGRINPGIVRISPDFTKDASITMLANSITLTPGTLTVDINPETHDLYIHWINVTNPTPTCKDICGDFPVWVRRITE